MGNEMIPYQMGDTPGAIYHHGENMSETQYQTTLPETNMAPENGWLENEFPFGMASWQVLC